MAKPESVNFDEYLAEKLKDPAYREVFWKQRELILCDAREKYSKLLLSVGFSEEVAKGIVDDVFGAVEEAGTLCHGGQVLRSFYVPESYSGDRNIHAAEAAFGISIKPLDYDESDQLYPGRAIAVVGTTDNQSRFWKSLK